MTKPTLYKDRLITCCMLICLFFIQSCRKDTLLPAKGANSLTIAEAKSYFESNIQFKILVKGKIMSAGSTEGHASEILFEHKQAIWEKAYQRLISTGSAVKIPIDFDGTDLVVNKRTKATIPMSALNYLFMYKDSLQQIHAEWVYLHPDSAWLYGDRANYTGKIIIKDWNGNIKRGFVYEKNRQPYSWTQKSFRIQKTASLSAGGKVSTTYGDPNSPDCVDMSFYQADNCPCVGHTWSQRADCGCYIKPVNGVEIVEVISCPPFDDTPNPSGGTTGNGQSPNGNGSTTGGTSPNPIDYTPTPCTNEPQFVNPDGSMSPMPCIPEPSFPPTQNPTNVPLTPTQYVIQKLGITDLDKVTFISDPVSGLSNAFAQYLIREQNSPYSIEFGQWLFEYLYSNQSVDYHTFLDPNEFDGINNLITSDPIEEEVINNGIEIGDVPPNEPLSPRRKIGSTQDRNNTEDMTYGTNASTSGILTSSVQLPDGYLFFDMKILFNRCTLASPSLRDVGNEMINRFQNNVGGTFEHPDLNQKVKESSQYKNFIKEVGNRMTIALENNNGDIDNMPYINMQLIRPVFNLNFNKVNGLQILVNDTEYTEINLLNFKKTGPNNWIADVDVVIYDHFGLDKHDAETYQSKHSGFAAWWLLQHTRGHKPFETKITVRSRIYGNY